MAARREARHISRQAAAAALFVKLTGSNWFAIFLPLLLAIMLGPSLLGLGLWRARIGPLWAPILWPVGVVAVIGFDVQLTNQGRPGGRSFDEDQTSEQRQRALHRLNLDWLRACVGPGR